MLSLVIFKFNNSNNFRDGLIAYYRGICILFDLGIKYYILNFGLDPYASSTWEYKWGDSINIFTLML